MSAQSINPVDTLLRGLWRENPVFVIQIGLCPTLAVTNTATNALYLGLATLVVLVMSSLVISVLRRAIAPRIQMVTSLVIIASFVTVADYAIQVVNQEVHHALGPFISLIVVNCLILGRVEGFALKNKLHLVLLDAIGMGTGFLVALLALGSIRELLGNGSLLGYDLLGPRFEPFAIMAMPPGGFFVLGTSLLVLGWLNGRKSRSKTAEVTRHAG